MHLFNWGIMSSVQVGEEREPFIHLLGISQIIHLVFLFGTSCICASAPAHDRSLDRMHVDDDEDNDNHLLCADDADAICGQKVCAF